MNCTYGNKICLTHYQTTNFRLFQTKEFADDNFKFDENGRKLSKWAENTVGKGEIARYEQFLLFSQCFQKACFPEASKGVIVLESVKLPLIKISRAFTIPMMVYKNTNGRKRNPFLITCSTIVFFTIAKINVIF